MRALSSVAVSSALSGYLTTLWILVLIVLAIGLVSVIVMPRVLRWTKVRRFRDRENLSLEALYQRHFFDTGLPFETVSKALEEIADDCAVPIGLLRPNDRFEQELRPIAWYESVDYLRDLQLNLIEKVGRGAPVSPPITINTVRDYVLASARMSTSST